MLSGSCPAGKELRAWLGAYGCSSLRLLACSQRVLYMKTLSIVSGITHILFSKSKSFLISPTDKSIKLGVHIGVSGVFREDISNVVM